MFCNKCGSQLTENDQFCKNCGATVNAQEENNNVGTPAVPTIVDSREEAVQPAITASEPAKSEVTPVVQKDDSLETPIQPATPSVTPVQAQPVVQQPKANNSIKYIVIGVVAVVALFAAMKIFGSNNNGGAGGGTGTEPTVVPAVQSTYKVNFKGFRFEIPDNLIYKEDGSTLLVGDSDDTWLASFGVVSGDFNKVKANKEKLASIAQSHGMECKNIQVKTFEGVEYVSMECSKSGNSEIVAYAKINSMNCVAMDIFNKSYTIDYDLFKEVSPIVKSITIADDAQTNISSVDSAAADIMGEVAE